MHERQEICEGQIDLIRYVKDDTCKSLAEKRPLSVEVRIGRCGRISIGHWTGLLLLYCIGAIELRNRARPVAAGLKSSLVWSSTSCTMSAKRFEPEVSELED